MGHFSHTHTDSSTSRPTFHHKNTAGVQSKSISEVLKCKTTFGTLTTALKTADLIDALDNGDTKFTVFAPTDNAFAIALDNLGLTAQELLSQDELLKKSAYIPCCSF